VCSDAEMAAEPFEVLVARGCYSNRARRVKRPIIARVVWFKSRPRPTAPGYGRRSFTSQGRLSP
jgi:hypothetical protein